MVTAAKNEAHAFPSFLPDGRHFIYIRAPQEIGIYVGSLDAKPDQQSSKRMLATTVMASYVASHDQAPGRLLFMREGSLWAQRFDAQRFELFGEAVPVARHVSRFLLSAAFSVSGDGDPGVSLKSVQTLPRISTKGKDLALIWPCLNMYSASCSSDSFPFLNRSVC